MIFDHVLSIREHLVLQPFIFFWDPKNSGHNDITSFLKSKQNLCQATTKPIRIEMDIHISCPKSPLIDPDGCHLYPCGCMEDGDGTCVFCAFQTERNTATCKKWTSGYMTAAICEHDANEQCATSSAGAKSISPSWIKNTKITVPSSSSNHIFQVRIMRCLKPGQMLSLFHQRCLAFTNTQKNTCFEVEQFRILSASLIFMANLWELHENTSPISLSSLATCWVDGTILEPVLKCVSQILYGKKLK